MAGIIVLGNNAFVLGFRLAGIQDAFVEEHIEKRLAILLNEKNASIIVIHDIDYAMLSPAMKRRVNESMEPVVVSIGKLDEENIRERIKRAIGIDLYKSESRNV